MNFKVSNEAIYEKLLDIEQHVIETNGKVKNNKWIATTALTLSILLIGLLVSHMGG